MLSFVNNIHIRVLPIGFLPLPTKSGCFCPCLPWCVATKVLIFGSRTIRPRTIRPRTTRPRTIRPHWFAPRTIRPADDSPLVWADNSPPLNDWRRHSFSLVNIFKVSQQNVQREQNNSSGLYTSLTPSFDIYRFWNRKAIALSMTLKTAIEFHLLLPFTFSHMARKASEDISTLSLLPVRSHWNFGW